MLYSRKSLETFVWIYLLLLAATIFCSQTANSVDVTENDVTLSAEKREMLLGFILLILQSEFLCISL